MQDKDIRSILVEYLKIQHPDGRLFQEKSIGPSVCDVMLVTDHLTGFEIKSDRDNYERLRQQVAAYDQFFDENYIVVGASHSAGIEARVPPHWGILVIEPSNIRLLRNAEKNRQVKRDRQLSILWKLELKNILLKNNLPIYPQKNKSFLRDVILKNIPKQNLGKQIAQELLHREELSSASNETVEFDELSLFPTEEILDRLSESDLSAFTLDKWMAIYQSAVQRRKQKEESILRVEQTARQACATGPRTPYTQIEVSLGAPWISAEIISQFVVDILKVSPQRLLEFDRITRQYRLGKEIPIVRMEKLTGYWHVEKFKSRKTPELTAIYGTLRYNAMQILDSTLNLRPIRIYDGSVYNEAETLAAIEKQKALQKAFKQWIWQSKARQWEVEEAYHQLFGGYGATAYDGSHLELADMNKEIQLFDYQKNAVQKIISTPNTLLAFDVGAGKTYIMIAAAMEMRKSGLSRKNMFVVPNNIVGQWEKMFLHLYPTAKVLAVDPKSFSAEKRGKVLKQIQKEDYDGIIIAYSCFEMIPLSSKVLLQDMHHTLRQFEQRLGDIRKEGFHEAGSAIRREMQYVQKTMNSMIGCINEVASDIPFDALEINTLFVDEAHNFKNIPLRTNLKQIRGISTTGSQKCMQMLKKVHFVQQSNGGRGVVFATGTPLCNSISDTYAMQCYLQMDELKAKRLDRFDNWVKTFARVEDVCEIDVDTSGFRIVSRFKEFFNLPELSRMFGSISIFHHADSPAGPINWDYRDITIEKSTSLDDYMKQLYSRTEAIRSGSVDRKKDNMLKVSTDGRKAALSLALVGQEDSIDAHSKLQHCANNVLDVYHQCPGCSQLVFCDYSTPKSQGYSVYAEVKHLLERAGVPPKEIAFIHDYQSEERKIALFEAVNAGRIRVLIGSTFKLGIGANVQAKLKAIHHLDVPWRPADMVQREGRILRRGNENREVFIFRYIIKGSFDSYSWQILQTKQHFISQFLAGNNTLRSVSDLDSEELNYAEVKALALDEPLMKQYAETENALRNARILLQQERKQKDAACQEMENLNAKILQAEEQIHKNVDISAYIRKQRQKQIAKWREQKTQLEEQLTYHSDTQERIILLEKELKDIFEQIRRGQD